MRKRRIEVLKDAQRKKETETINDVKKILETNLSCESKFIELIKEYNESHPNVANIPEDVTHVSLSMFLEIMYLN